MSRMKPGAPTKVPLDATSRMVSTQVCAWVVEKHAESQKAARTVREFVVFMVTSGFDMRIECRISQLACESVVRDRSKKGSRLRWSVFERLRMRLLRDRRGKRLRKGRGVYSKVIGRTGIRSRSGIG